MIPLLPPSTHLDFARELTKDRLVNPDDIDFVASRQLGLAPDPIYLAVNRVWIRLTGLVHGGIRRHA